MVTIFNRKELTTTYSRSEQAEIREALAGAGVPYHLRMVDTASGGGRSRQGRFGVDTSRTTEYIFYVRREDFDRALSVIGRSEIR